MSPRILLPGQRARLFTFDVVSGERRLVVESSSSLFEAPNWSPDGAWLVVNADGLLLRVAATGGALQQIDLAGVPELNNDHVIAPDGRHHYVTARDGHLYEVPFAGGSFRRVSNDRERFKRYLHGVSPDGATLSFIGGSTDAAGVWSTNVYTMSVSSGEDVAVTTDNHEDDGAEFSPDAAWLYFNSTRGSTEPGHAQLFRMRLDGSTPEQLTFDERVNWFPHVSPDGERLLYLSYPRGTLGHPADREVILRLISPAGGRPRDLIALSGGQGTINVPCWAPDGRSFAYVDYPMDSPPSSAVMPNAVVVP